MTMTAPSLPQYKSPHIVGSQALLIHAAEDFAGELTRQRPWVKARYEAVLDTLDDVLSVRGPAPLHAYLHTDRGAYVAGLPASERAVAAQALREFDEYLADWGWLPEA